MGERVCPFHAHAPPLGSEPHSPPTPDTHRLPRQPPRPDLSIVSLEEDM